MNVAIFTGTRAEFGLFKPLLDCLKKDPVFNVRLLVTGTHLSPEFGKTIQQIEQDGFAIDEKVEMLLSSDSEIGVIKSMGLALIGYSEALQRLKPDILMVLGDRYEAFCVASAALLLRIPVGHIHGGELTEGAVDDAFRHAITKMSLLHFTSTEQYRKRVIQLGEAPDRVFNVGAIGLDNITKMKLLTREEIEREIGRPLKSKNFLITFHPVTLEGHSAERQFKLLLEALSEYPDSLCVFTKANADPEGRNINLMIDEYTASHSDSAVSFVSLGQLRYLSLMRFVDAVIGNSSSGIIEAPSFNVPTINIGDRQKGRIKAASVIDCSPENVGQAIRRALEVHEPTGGNSPYGDGHAAEKITSYLRSWRRPTTLKKSFHDVKGENFES